MITRQQYMENSNELFHDYYAQFVTERIKEAVLRRFTKEQLEEYHAKDEHFNGVTRIQTWDQIMDPFIRETDSKMRELGDYLTQAGCVCVSKTAARIIIGKKG